VVEQEDIEKEAEGISIAEFLELIGMYQVE